MKGCLTKRREVIIRIKSVLTQGLIKGESYGKMAKGIQAGLEMEYTKAIRIARTEAHRCQQMGGLRACTMPRNRE